jgi:hypothetical protein
MRPAGSALIVLLAAAPAARAQNSVYGVLGPGFPARDASVRSRAMGSGPLLLDPVSAMNPGAVASLNVLTVTGASFQEFRQFTLGGTETSGLQQTRFPYVAVGGRLGATPLSYSLGFSQFAERSFDITTTDTVTLRGAPIEVSDDIASAGGVIDIRAAVAARTSAGVQLGLGLHLLSGSSKMTTTRRFSDSTFRSFGEFVDAEYTGLGVSAGVLATAAPGLRVAAAARINSRLERSVAGAVADRISLPLTLSAGAELAPSPAMRLALSGAWRSWGGAADDIAAGQAFNTWEAGAGFEAGGTSGGPRLPLRLGVRYATLPFSPTAEQPHELNFSAGTALDVAAGRVRMDITIERAMRDGGGISERAWELAVGFQMVP